jgi:thiamine-phosphate pyrophosphorylase
VADLGDRHLYLCTPDRPDLADFLVAAIKGGVDIVQLREKHLDARPLIERARLALQVCRDHDVPFILNDRADLALEVGADGVHVGQADAPPVLARRILGADAILGLSTRDPAQLAAAAAEPIDYVSTGPVNWTPTHPERPATGFGYLSHAAAHSPYPFYVTGGASPSTVPAMIEAGATRFVVVRWVCDAPDPAAAARALRNTIDEGLSALRR